ncbi:hypothetical protein V8F33_010480 [Rhypophila sp. PSN 637]
MIHAEAFSRHTNTFHDCSAESEPCCKAAFAENEVEKAIQEECDKEFGRYCWIYSNLKRRSVESANVPCQHGPYSDELSDQEGSDTAARTSEPGQYQSRIKRRRTEKPPPDPLPDAAARKLPDEAADSDPQAVAITNFAKIYYAKVRRGLEKLHRIKQDNSIGHLGKRLLELRRPREEGDGEKYGERYSRKALEELEELLKKYSSNSEYDVWLANLYSLYTGVRGRSLEKAHSATGKSKEEFNALKKEAMCVVTSEVVNNLQRYWGASASLIYNALRETRPKGSALASGKGIGRSQLGKVVEEITNLFLKKGFTFSIQGDLPVVNPAFFLTLIDREARYKDVCKSVKLDGFANLDLQEEINKHIDKLPILALNAGQIAYSILLHKEGDRKEWTKLEKSGDIWTVHLLPLREPQHDNPSSVTESPLQEPLRTPDDRRGRMCASPPNPFLGETDAGITRDQPSGHGLSPPTSQGQMFVDAHFRTPPDTSHGTDRPSILGFQAINRGKPSEPAILLPGSGTRHRSEPGPNGFQPQGNRTPEGSSPAATLSEQNSNLMELSVGGTRDSLPGNTSAASRSPWREVMGLASAPQPTVIIHPCNSGATIHGIPAFNDIQHRSGHTLQHQEVGEHDGASRPTQQGNSPFGTHEPIDMLVQAALRSDSGTSPFSAVPLSASTVQPIGGLGPISYLMLTGELAGTPGGPFINAEGSEWGVSQRNGSRRPSVGAEHVWQNAGDFRSEYSLRDGGMVDAQELGRQLLDMEHFIVWPESENIGEMDGAPEATSGIVI